MKHLTSFLIFLFCVVMQTAIAQTKGKEDKNRYKITGQVIDLEEYAPLQQAVVSLLNTDSSTIKSVVTSENGDFLLYAEKKSDYLLKVSFIGFKTKVQNLHVAGRTTTVPTIRLEQDAQLLSDVNITGNLPKVQSVEDTLIYNADAFRMPEGSVLEELIERLPGAEIEDGKVMINGREVKKILLDGKEFFVGDMQTALKNLPTAIIDKLKHYDEKSDMAKVTGIDDGEERPVIDVRIKKGMNFGYNVNADGGYGTDYRYSSRVNANAFGERSKLSFTGNANNVNDRSTPGRGGNRGSGGGGNGGGLRASKQLGLNLNYDDRKKLQMDGNVRWNHSDSDNDTRTASESFVSRNGSFSNSISKALSRSNGWNTEYRIEWKPTEDWNIQLRPTASVNTSDRLSTSANRSFNSDPYLFVDDPFADKFMFGDADTILINDRTNQSLGYTLNRNIGTSLQVNRKFGSNGRNLTLRVEASYSDSESNNITNNFVKLFKVKDKQGNDSTYYTNRYNLTPGKNQNYSAQVTYSEPVFENTFLQFSYRFQMRTNYSDRKTYDFSRLGEAFGYGIVPKYGAWDDYLANVGDDMSDYYDSKQSRYSEYTNYIHDLNLTFRIVRSKYNLSLGARYQPQTSHYKQDFRGVFVDTVRFTSHINPTMNFRYRFSRQHTLNVTYNANTQHPNISQLLDITDDSNPLNISKGNPALKPAFTNNFEIRWSNYIMSRKQNWTANLNYSTTSNNISNKVTYNDETGGRVTQPENINGNWNIRGSFGFSSALDKDANWNVSSNTDVRYQNHVSYLTLNRQSSSEKNKTTSTNISERITASYRNSWFEVEANGRINSSTAHNMLQPSANLNTWNYQYGCSFNIKLPWNMTIDTSFNQASRRGFSNAAYNTDEFIWNAQISQDILPRKQLVVTLQVFDLLGNQSNISRQINESRRSDSQNNSLTSYAMLHVIYQLRNFGGKNGRIGGGRGGNRGGSFGGGNRGGDGGFGGGNFGGGNRRGGRG